MKDDSAPEWEEILRGSSLDNGKEIVGLEVVRSLPGKRLVFLGEYAGAKVFVKLFLDPSRGQRHWQRELDGLEAFRRGKIPTADVIYSGQTAQHGWPVIILAQLTGMKSVKQAWSEADPEYREQLLRRMTILLARHHQAGLCQTDLHLDNFMLSEREIFSLDGAGVRFFVGGVDQETALQNLGLFMAQLTPEWESRVPEVYEIYAGERGWQNGPGSEALLRQVQVARAGRWKEFRNKLLRSCTAFSYTKQRDGFRVVAREYVGPEMSDLLRDPDASFPGAEQALKNGNTCTVWATAVNGHGVVIKRYNVKGFWHGLKLSLQRGRGLRSWVNGHRLLFYGIPTARPIALLKRRVGLLCSKAYLLTEQVQSTSAREWFGDPAVAREEKKVMADRIAQVLRDLQQQQISHGDLKASNILIGEGKAMLVDLDAMHQHASTAKFKQAWSKDIQRFLKNWCDDKELVELFTNSLKSNGIDPV
jgi:tRNA A-37 threonylcarbamoyl transferase component Bud32